MASCSGQLVGDLRFAQGRAEQLDLLDCVANEIWKTIYGRVGLNQQIVVGSPQPRSDRVVRGKESASRFRFAPTSHRTKLEDSHPFYAGVLGTSVGDDALYPSAVDS
jgi:hypothetical protein